MKSNEIVRREVLNVIRNQIRDNKPPETKQTLERLKGLGYSEIDAQKLIGQCVALEIFDILKQKKSFNLSRYVANLKKLPDEPLDN